VIALDLFLIHLIPHPMTLALDLTAFNREDAEAVDWSNECKDFAEDLAADFIVEEGSISWLTKKKRFCSLLND